MAWSDAARAAAAEARRRGKTAKQPLKKTTMAVLRKSKRNRNLSEEARLDKAYQLRQARKGY